MKLSVLGCGGGIGGRDRRTTSLLVDDDILIDGGSGVGDLPFEDLLKINHVFVTHAHLDHVAFIPFLVDSVGESRDKPIVLYASEETIRILRSHIFNWLVWPDFSTIPDRKTPFLRYQVLKQGDTVRIDQRKIQPFTVHHTVPAFGYIVDSGQAQLAFSGDTTYTPDLAKRLNALDRLEHLILECAFPDRHYGLAMASRHMCPSLVGVLLAELTGSPKVYFSHLKPGCQEEIMAEIHALQSAYRTEMLVTGSTIHF